MDSRFDRHRLIGGWRQELLEAATVIVAGAGALGNELTRILAMAGTGRLIVCDPDVVALSNLSRCSLFLESDVGEPKVAALKKNLKTLAPNSRVDARCGKFLSVVGLADIRDARLVISCVDSAIARVQLASRCQLAGTRYIDGGTNAWGGEVRLFLEQNGPCYACYNPDVPGSDNNGNRQSCSNDGTVAATGSSIVMTSIVASWMADFVIRYVLDLECPRGILRINGGTGECKWVEGRRNESCLYHFPISKPPMLCPVDHHCTIGELMACMPENTFPLLWEAAPLNSFSMRKEYDLRRFDKNERLYRLGVPSREILPCQRGEESEYIELL